MRKRALRFRRKMIKRRRRVKEGGGREKIKERREES